MIEKLEALERLGRLHESGVLSDDEFQQAKKRILESVEADSAAQAVAETPVERPSRWGEWRSRARSHPFLVAGVATALLLGIGAAYLIVLDLNDARPAADQEQRRAPKSGAGAPARTAERSGRDLHAFLEFEEPRKCGLGSALRSAVEAMTAGRADAAGSSAAPTIRVAGLERAVPAEVKQVSVGGPNERAAVARLPLEGVWHGLQVRELRTVSWPGTRISSVQIRFREPVEQVRRALNAQQFDLPAVGETRADADAERIVAIGIEQAGEGSALTCIRG
jgi:putative oligomerization/nucleic acid binding protein